MKAMEPNISKIPNELDVSDAENLRLQQLCAKKDDERFKIIFERSALGNKIIDASLRIIKVNEALLKLLGYKAEELLGKRITDIAHPNYIAGWKILQKELWTRKKPSFSIDTCIIKKDGTALSLRVTSIIFPDKHETFGYTVLEDITERIELGKLKEDTQRLQFKIEKHEFDRVNRKNLAARILEAQENERNRIGESLHNSIGQSLYAVKLSMERIKPKINSIEDNSLYLRDSMLLLEDAIKETRRISHELTPAILVDFGLQSALEEICKQFMGTLSLKCHIQAQTKDLDNYLATTIFRTAQELVLNIVKHASASTATISLSRRGSTIVLTIEDNGRGFSAVDNSEGIGLRTIRSKVDLLHGSMNIISKENKGTSIVITLPVNLATVS